MESKQGKEKRKFIRIDGVEYVLSYKKYVFQNEKEQKAYVGTIKNFSAGGGLFESSEKYEINQVLQIEISVPGWEKFKNEFYKSTKLSVEEPVIALAKVVRVELVKEGLYDIGVCFIGIDQGHQWALIKQVNASLGGE